MRLACVSNPTVLFDHFEVDNDGLYKIVNETAVPMWEWHGWLLKHLKGKGSALEVTRAKGRVRVRVRIRIGLGFE